MCGCLLGVPYWGPGLQPRHVPWTGNRTGDSLVHRPVLNPLSHTSQGNKLSSNIAVEEFDGTKIPESLYVTYYSLYTFIFN